MIKDAYYAYRFSNGESHQMKPIEAHKYALRKMINIVSGPNYAEGKRQKSFDGFGWHSGLQRNFKGPRDYRDYLKANGIEEWGDCDPPKFTEESPPYWNDETLKKASSCGMEIGSVLAEALKSGKLKFPEDAQ